VLRLHPALAPVKVAGLAQRLLARLNANV
jgi:hypothetical protein